MEDDTGVRGPALRVAVLVAVFAVLALRIGLQTALLHEGRDPMNPRWTGAVPALRPRRARYGVLPELRGGGARGITDRRALRGEPMRPKMFRPATRICGACGVVCGDTSATHHLQLAAHRVGCRRRRRSRGGRDGGRTGDTRSSRAIRVPAGLRATPDRQAGRIEPALRVQRWRILSPVPRPGNGIRGAAESGRCRSEFRRAATRAPCSCSDCPPTIAHRSRSPRT